ncbi:MAG: glycosyltransferase [Candidatus Gastranaerophilales bacterium]|nr:glycosyltransferase [Candidatus Gastranaerophilales bacterium]MCM1073732.1 glycosyltransferase [Bacteroides sp.]
MVKVSAIVPVYNVERYLEQCLDSIVHQTLQDIEVICVNDGSKDSSKEILERFAAKDSRIKLINKDNGGYGSACNRGLAEANGEFISIIEPDDYIDKNMYSELYNIASYRDVDIVKSAYYEYNDPEDGIEYSLKKIRWSEDYDMPEGKVFEIKDCSQLLYFHPSIWSCLYRKEFLDKHNIKFVEAKGGGWVDNPFQIQTLCLSKRICYTDKAYYYYRLSNPTSSSNIVDISFPFDRSNEVHAFLDGQNIDDKNILAHLYKREFSYIHIILGGVTKTLLGAAVSKIQDMINRMDSRIIYSNNYITEYERNFYEGCKTESGILDIMKELKARKHNVTVVD